MNKQENRERLFVLDKRLRAEADAFLIDSGVGNILKEEGFHSVGSYMMKTMTWRDLDFERYDKSPDWQKHWILGEKLAKLKWVWSAHAINGYKDPRGPVNDGYYWGLRAIRPGEKDFWKLDLWTARKEEFERAAPNRLLWQSRLNDDKRYDILVIKEAVCMLPEYRDTILSVHIYEAVLECGIRGIKAFREWWKKEKVK